MTFFGGEINRKTWNSRTEGAEILAGVGTEISTKLICVEIA
jgi:hypothetical protein